MGGDYPPSEEKQLGVERVSITTFSSSVQDSPDEVEENSEQNVAASSAAKSSDYVVPPLSFDMMPAFLPTFMWLQVSLRSDPIKQFVFYARPRSKGIYKRYVCGSHLKLTDNVSYMFKFERGSYFYSEIKKIEWHKLKESDIDTYFQRIDVLGGIKDYMVFSFQ